MGAGIMTNNCFIPKNGCQQKTIWVLGQTLGKTNLGWIDLGLTNPTNHGEVKPWKGQTLDMKMEQKVSKQNEIDINSEANTNTKKEVKQNKK